MKFADHKEETGDAKGMDVPPPSIGKLLALCKPEWFKLVLSFFLMIISELTNMVIPIILSGAYNALVDDEDETPGDEDNTLEQIHSVMAMVFISFGASIVASFFQSTINGITSQRLVSRLRNRLYHSILHQDIAFFDTTSTGELVSRLGSDTTLLQGIIGQSIPELSSGVFQVASSMVFMIYISPKLAGVAFGSAALVCILCVPVGKLLGKFSKRYQDALGQAQTRATEAFGAIRTVQSFGSEMREWNRYQALIGDPDKYSFWRCPPPASKEGPLQKSEKSTEPSSSTYRTGYLMALTNSTFYTFIFGGGFGLLYLTLWYGFYLVYQGELTVGDLTAFQSYVFSIGFGFGMIGTHASTIFEGLGASGRVFYLLEREASIKSNSEEFNDDKTARISSESLECPDSSPHMDGVVEFRNVEFSYPSRPESVVLKDFSIKLEPNTTTALVGSSGAGKSTAVGLLQRFYDVSGGKITIDGKDIRDLDLQWMRSHIGSVQQEPQLFGMSVRENLLYGIDDKTRPNITEADIEHVCREANAHDFIMSWPQGYETILGERGLQLSGGQKQRLAIARALIADCRILLLDEATSALDAESENLVQGAISHASAGRTVLIVAHRLSTIQQATQIVVMEDHKIIGVGNHSELLKSCPKYQDLIRRQQIGTPTSS